MNRSKQILFILHDSGLTGATMVLLQCIRYLNEHGDFKLHFVLPTQGAAENELHRYGEVHILRRAGNRTSLAERLVRKVKPKKNISPFTELVGTIRPGLIYANTLSAEPLLKEIPASGTAPLVWHIHELPLAVSTYRLKVNDTLRKADLIIANSSTTLKYLEKDFGVRSEKAVVINPCVAAKYFANHAPRRADVFRVCSSGTAVTRKGIEMFVLLAVMLNGKLQGKRLEFVWIGHTGNMLAELNHDIEKAGLGGVISFTGQIDNPEGIFTSCDAYVCLSKEESFGLAPLEAAACGVPLLCFKGSGHVEQIVASCGGITVDYMNLESLADELVRLSSDDGLWSIISKTGAGFAKDYTAEKLLPTWLDFVNRTYKQ